MKKRIGIQGFLMAAAFIAVIFCSKFIFPHGRGRLSDEILDSMGLCLVLLGFYFRIAARGYKEEHSDNGSKLVTDGPYTFIQNPMYFGTLLIGIGVIIVLFEPWVLCIFLLIYCSIYIPQTKKEGLILSERFGQGYHDYCRQTPKYFPKVLPGKNPREGIALKWPWIKKELPSLSIIIMVIMGIELWEDTLLFGGKTCFNELLEFMLIIAGWSIILILGNKKNSG